MWHLKKINNQNVNGLATLGAFVEIYSFII